MKTTNGTELSRCEGKNESKKNENAEKDGVTCVPFCAIKFFYFFFSPLITSETHSRKLSLAFVANVIQLLPHCIVVFLFRLPLHIVLYLPIDHFNSFIGHKMDKIRVTMIGECTRASVWNMKNYGIRVSPIKFIEKAN